VWENVRDELQDASNELLEDEANGMPLDVEVEFMGLRLEYRSVYVLQVLCNGQYTAFVQQFTVEQPRYHDRPSDADDALRRDDDFPAPTDILLLPLRHGDEKTIEMVVALTLHHIAYACNLFAKTEYAPTDEAVEALMEWGVYQISSMLSEPMGRMPLRARKHCAGMNIRGVQESVVSKGRQVLRGCPDKYPHWEMYTWYAGCLQRELKEKLALLSQTLISLGPSDVAEPDATPVAHFTPGSSDRLRIPDELVDRWQSYNTNVLEDVRFEAIGPTIDVREIAEITVSPDPETCALCWEDFAEGGTFPDAFEASCGHSFHGTCLSTMVNGIEPSSNRCPLCRKTICVARERTRINSSTEADPFTSQTEAKESTSEFD
jgi:hypothetical protein